MEGAVPGQPPLRDAAQIGPRTVFQYARDDKFYAINIVSGRSRWKNPDDTDVDDTDDREVLALMDNNVYLLDKQNNLRIVDEVLGPKKGLKTTLPLSGLDLYVPNTTAPAIYVGNHVTGELFCFRPISAGYIKPSDLPPPPSKK